MSFQIAAMVAGVAFLLSFLSAWIGGVPLFDMVLRALLWAAVGLGGCLGLESLLRTMVPDLFVAREEATSPEESPQGQAVNITLEEELVPRGGFVEEVDQDAPPSPRSAVAESSALEPEPAREAPSRDSGAAAPESAPSGEEEMPEIGSFLDAFKPEAPEGAEAAPSASSSPDYGEYAPVEPDRRSPSGEVTIDGEAQDPALLARAVQTVLKRDAQGN